MNESSLQAECWFPAMPQLIDVAGQRVALYQHGQGPPLLLLHAAPAWSFIYRDFLFELAPHFRCLAVDFPGFGLSPEPVGGELSLRDSARLVEELIRQLDLEDLSLLVHDSAGGIGLGAAGRMPERVRGLIITDTFAWSLQRGFARITKMLRLVTSPPFSLLQSRLNLIPWAAITTSHGATITKREKAAFLNPFSSVRRRARVLHVFRGLLCEHEFLDEVETNLKLHLADKPSLVMFGDRDPAIRAGFEDRWRQILTNATYARLPNQMHFPHFGAARAMCKHIVAWSKEPHRSKTSEVRAE